MNAYESRQAWLNEMARSGFAESLGEIALYYLGWPERIRVFERDALRQPPSKPGIKQRSAKGKESQERKRFSEIDLKSEFSARFQATHRDWALEDTNTAISMLFDHCTRLTDWIEVLVRLFRIDLTFEDEEPQIAIETETAWRTLTNHFDPDAIVCYLLARQGHADAIGTLKRWGAATRIGDRDLSLILAEGVSDLHIHLGGARSAQLLWNRIISGSFRPEFVNRYSDKTIRRLATRDRPEWDVHVTERDRIHSLVGLIADLEQPLGWCWAGVSQTPPSEDGPTYISTILLRERAMMARAWSGLLDSDRSDVAPAADPDWHDRLERQLDLYLHSKNAFFTHHRQAEGTNPGLGAFRQFYDAVVPIWPQPGRLPARFQRSLRLRAQDYAEYAHYILQSQCLSRVELRMAPLESPRAYHEFFSAWAVLEKNFGLAERKVDIRFAIHFKRSLEARGADSAASGRGASGHALRKFLMMIDRDSANLHSYRSEDKWRSHAWRIARIDFAGQERDLPPDIASFCMNLARGEHVALEALQNPDCDAFLHRSWLLHRERVTAKAARGLPTLGITCHTGEDYAHPLEGIYSIVSAVKLLNLRAGDTIGHGLALGQDVSRYDQTLSRLRLTSRGLQFDALLWLYLECQQKLGEGAAEKIMRLESWLRKELHEIYGASAWRVQSIASLDSLLFDCRRRPVLDRAKRPLEPCARLRHLEIWNDECGAKRAARVPIASIVYDLAALIERAQHHVLRQLAEKGIILEFNPASNLRVSGALTTSEIPFMRILRVAGSQVLATINTDNPGTFGTRIENEYALVMRALVEARFTRAEALEVVRRLRDVGLHYVYWPSRPVSATPKGDVPPASDGEDNAPADSPEGAIPLPVVATAPAPPEPRAR